jgi:hypothetical protein
MKEIGEGVVRPLFFFGKETHENHPSYLGGRPMNELILAASVLFIFGAVLLAYRLFGNVGLYAMTAVVTILSNIEVLILVNAFGMEQTLGNVLFAATFLITDILSETAGKKQANTAVFIGIFASIFFVLLSSSWLLYTPSESDWVMPSIVTIFSSTPRMVLASMLVYALSQLFDVWLYHKWWAFTDKKFKDHRRFLWLRNNGSTMISQMVNTVLFTLGAFAGMEGYTASLLGSIMLSSYVIYFVTALLDTPAVYLARRIHEKAALPSE